jgi:hypothetical protein
MSSFTYDLMNLLVDSGLAEHLATAFETDAQTVKEVLLEFSPSETKKTVKKTTKKEKTVATKAKKVPEKPVNLSKLTISQLKELCTEKGLSSDGKKADLITRIEKGEKKPTAKPTAKKTATKTATKVSKKTAKKVESESEVEEKPKKSKSVTKSVTKKAPVKSKKEEPKEESEPVPEDVDEDAEETFPAKDYSKLSIAELKGLLDARGLPKTGKKDELVERLTWDDLDTEIDEVQPEDGPGNTQPVEDDVTTVEEVDAQEEEVPEDEE